MCGRFTLTTPVAQLAEQFDAVPQIEEGEVAGPQYNVAPTQTVVGVVQPQASSRELRAFHWGLIPFWAKDRSIGNRMINARAETLAEKPAFRKALTKRRCLVLADGFYEWQPGSEKGAKQPFYIYRADGKTMAFAGLWERWQPAGGERVDSCTIITIPPNDLMAPIHDRMPAILGDEAIAAWLDPTLEDPATLLELLAPIPGDRLTTHAVSTRVNSPRFNDATCLAPL